VSGLSLARAGSVLGLGITFLLTMRLASVQATRNETGLIWGLAFGLAYVAPFLLASVALWSRDLHRRGTLCVGAGIAGLLLMFTSLAGVTLILFVPAILLVLGGIRLLEDESTRVHGPTLTFILGPVGAVVVTFAALFARAAASFGFLVAALAMWFFLLARVRFQGRQVPTSGEVRL
jgi:hypothetical protein